MTTPTRTLLDLAGTWEEERFEIAFDHCLANGLTSLPRLEWRLNELGRRPGAGLVRELIAVRRVTSIPRSPLETRTLRGIRRRSFELPVCQHPIHDATGRLVGIVDFAYPDRKIAIEADGFSVHSGRVSFEHDRRRLNELTQLGWIVLFVTDRHLDDALDHLKSLLTQTPNLKN